MDIFMIVLDFFLGISYLGAGFTAAPIDWFDIFLGVAWSMIGGANIYQYRRRKRIQKQFEKEMADMESKMNRLQ